MVVERTCSVLAIVTLRLSEICQHRSVEFDNGLLEKVRCFGSFSKVEILEDSISANEIRYHLNTIVNRAELFRVANRYLFPI